jgi:hypothetical protein
MAYGIITDYKIVIRTLRSFINPLFKIHMSLVAKKRMCKLKIVFIYIIALGAGKT